MSHTEPDKTMQSIIEALETAPHVNVPDDFAARVMARLPQQSTRRLRMPALPARSHYGRTAAVTCMVILVVAMVVLAPHTMQSRTLGYMQALLFAQLAALLLWIGLNRSHSR